MRNGVFVSVAIREWCDMRRYTFRRFVNIFLVAAVFGSYFAIFFFGTGSLVQNGIGSLRYFTMLSNLFVGFVAIAWLKSSHSKGAGIDGRTGSGDKPDARIERLKYIAAASVGLTCATILGFLGPIYGYKEMLAGANLFMHLVTPVAAMAEIIFLSDVSYTRRDNRLAMIPPLLYGLVYLANILINGRGEWPATNDWYFFFAWGYPVGIIIYVVLLTVTWLLALLMRKLQRKKQGKQTLN